MSYESEAAAALRAEPNLTALLTGGIYESATLGSAGITDPTTTPGAYSGGRLLPSAIVRARAETSALGLEDLKIQHASMQQVLEVYLYQRNRSNIIDQAKDWVYAVLQGRALSGSWPLQFANGLGPVLAPELNDTMLIRVDYQVHFIKRPVVAP